MPPIEGVDFPALGDKIVERLLAIWTFVRDLCLLVWDHVCQALWVAWTYPPFETFRNEFAAAMISLMNYAVAHPVTSLAIAVLVFIVIPRILITVHMAFVRCLGFRRQGVLRGSSVVNYRSTNYGGNVPRHSAPTRGQSQWAGGGRYRTIDGSPDWC